MTRQKGVVVVLQKTRVGNGQARRLGIRVRGGGNPGDADHVAVEIAVARRVARVNVARRESDVILGR